MEAFGASPAPVGLGMDVEDLFSLTWRQYGALRDQWTRYHQAQIDMLAILRADLHNAHMPRKDGRAWEPQEFGASGKRQPRKYGPRKWTPEEVRQRAMGIFGADGKGAKPYQQGSALAKLRGTGQPIPMPKRA